VNNEWRQSHYLPPPLLLNTPQWVYVPLRAAATVVARGPRRFSLSVVGRVRYDGTGRGRANCETPPPVPPTPAPYGRRAEHMR